MDVPDPHGRPPPDMIGTDEMFRRLRDDPGVFVWQQAVRIAESAAVFKEGFGPPGFSGEPGSESPRLLASPQLNHAYADVAGFFPGDGVPDRLLLTLADASERHSLLGAHGALPAWYSELALERKGRGDGGLAEFLAMFEHRLLSLSYRGWWHHRLEVRREKAGADLPDMDQWFDSLAGLGTPALSERLHRGVGWLIRRFAPLFANMARPASGLAALLSAYVGAPVRIREMTVRWRRLDSTDQNRLPDETREGGRNCRLGLELILGESIREAQSNFQIEAGPFAWAAFQRLLPAPAGREFEGLCELAQLFAGPDRVFTVRMSLAPGEVRGLCLGGDDAGNPHLGWNVWLVSESPDIAVNDASFCHGGHID